MPKAKLQYLQQLIYRHTAGGGYQAEALKLLDSNYKRFAVEIKSITCSKCKHTLEDCVRWTDKRSGKIADSWGYIELGDDHNVHNVCYHCDGGGGYIGPIFFVPRGKK